jgi:hypothetical protein
MENTRFDIFRLKGKLAGIRDWMTSHHIPPRLMFYLMGIISTLWFIVRVVPKPSRAAYPCMRVAAPLMSGFFVYVLSLGGATFALKRLKSNLLNARYLASALFLLVAVTGMMFALLTGTQFSVAGIQTESKLGPDDGQNQPFGKAQGVHPGRVVWVWDPNSTNEKCASTFDTQDWYWKPENINSKVVSGMFRNSLNKLTGKDQITSSWDLLFHSFNVRKSNKDKGYEKGEKIFIKINQGTARWLLEQRDKDKGYYYPTTLKPEETRRRESFGPTETNPYVVLEILRELVNELGISQENITVGDPMTDIYGHNFDIWVKEFPQVRYTDKFSDKFGRTLIHPTAKDLLFYSDKSQSDKLFDVIENADYLINVANLKPHMSAGISLTAKNHFGSQASPTAGHLHYSLITRGSRPTNGGYRKYRVLVDMMGSRYLGQNTLIYIVDGLFGGGASETQGPVKYFMSPFNNDWSSSIFLSQDQVALESVCYDFLRAEWNGINIHNASNNAIEIGPSWNGVDDYLHQAASPENWPEGIVYDPDNSGKPLTSLGVHEHWNNPEEKCYSRNLGVKEGIELLAIPDYLVKNK